MGLLRNHRRDTYGIESAPGEDDTLILAAAGASPMTAQICLASSAMPQPGEDIP
jgi:hypothetical protein